eukprot:scaffold3401_cov26-Tisochrysis_lutea.AAC.2
MTQEHSFPLFYNSARHTRPSISMRAMRATRALSMCTAISGATHGSIRGLRHCPEKLTQSSRFVDAPSGGVPEQCTQYLRPLRPPRPPLPPPPSPRSSTSNKSVALGGMSGGAPRGP